jgi:hypothetical protein
MSGSTIARVATSRSLLTKDSALTVRFRKISPFREVNSHVVGSPFSTSAVSGRSTRQLSLPWTQSEPSSHSLGIFVTSAGVASPSRKDESRPMAFK